jgi:aspartyl/asparaginyl beta-hydroxylase (cupin superfamily)
METVEIANLRKTGADALRSGDARIAREAFERLIAGGQADVNIFLALGGACARLGDAGAAQAAVDKALNVDPRNLRALVFKGDLLAHEGDARAASSFYLAALRQAPRSNEVPADLRADLERADAMCRRYALELESVLAARLAQAGFAPSDANARFAHSLELLFGRKQIYFQHPTYYYFPELPQIQFYARAAFPWLDAIEARAAEIREEVVEILGDDGAFRPYVEKDPRRPDDPEERMLDNPEWSAFYLWKNGARVDANAARCPRTLEALEQAPLARIPNRSPTILFSLLRPGAHIPPHNGATNTRLIVHLPLIVPSGSRLRVGNDSREWVEGRAYVFDDTIENEAANAGDRNCVVLVFDIWRPELAEEERRLVRATFEAIDSHSTERGAWRL